MSAPGATRSLTMEANAASLHTAMEFFQAGAREAGLPERRLGELDLLIEEIFMNVCRHAYVAIGRGAVTLSYAVPAAGKLNVEIADQGPEFNPLEAPPPDLALELDRRRAGGLGIFLMKTFAPSASYRRDRGWNRLSLHLPADA